MKKKPVIASAVGTLGPRKGKRYDIRPAIVVAAKESAELWLTRVVTDGPSQPARVSHPDFDDWWGDDE